MSDVEPRRDNACLQEATLPHAREIHVLFDDQSKRNNFMAQ